MSTMNEFLERLRVNPAQTEISAIITDLLAHYRDQDDTAVENVQAYLQVDGALEIDDKEAPSLDKREDSDITVINNKLKNDYRGYSVNFGLRQIFKLDKPKLLKNKILKCKS